MTAVEYKVTAVEYKVTAVEYKTGEVLDLNDYRIEVIDISERLCTMSRNLDWKMSITQRSYNSIVGILKKLESDPTDNTFLLSRQYIKNIIVGESKNTTTEVKCWDCDYDYNYLLFNIDSMENDVDNMKSLLTFKRVNSSDQVTNRVDVRYDDELEAKAIPLIDAITPLLSGLNNIMNQSGYNNLRTIEDTPAVDELD